MISTNNFMENDGSPHISAFLSEKYSTYEVRQVKIFQKIFPKTEKEVGINLPLFSLFLSYQNIV